MIVQIAEAVKDSLNGATFSLPFVATRRYLVRAKLADMATLHVTVVPATLEISKATRTRHEHEYAVDVGVQQRYSAEVTEVDALILLVEEIADHLRQNPVAGAHFVGIENKPVVLPEHMEELSQFTSVLRAYYLAVR